MSMSQDATGQSPSGDDPSSAPDAAKPRRLQAAAGRKGHDPAEADAGRGEMRLGVIAMGILFLGFGGWASLAPLASAVSAPGVVVVSGNRQTVQHREGGIVARLAVREGQRVEQGEVLIELSSVELRAQERGLQGRAIELEAMRARLVAELEGKRRIERPANWETLPAAFVEDADRVLARQQRELDARGRSRGAQLGVLGERRSQLLSRIRGYNDQIASLDRQASLIQDELVGVRQLADRGLMPLPRVRALERTQAEIDGRRAELRSLIQQSREAIGESRMQGLAVNEDRFESAQRELRETDTQLADVSPRLEAVRAELERTLIRAPATGQVVGLRVFTVGGVVRAGDPLLDVVPEDQPLVLDAQVSAREADDLKVGMRTEVRFTSISGGQLPILFGEVSRISADRFTDERTGAPYFLAQVVVSKTEMQRIEGHSGNAVQIRAGLPVEVIVPLRSRTALQYLIEPLDRQLWRSFREQ